MEGKKIIMSLAKSLQRLPISYVVIFVSVVCLLTGGSFFLEGSSSSAQNNTSYKYYTSIEIKSGDTLWSIASEYMTEEYESLWEYIAEIKELNGLQCSDIRSGQFLVIPYYSNELK